MKYIFAPATMSLAILTGCTASDAPPHSAPADMQASPDDQIVGGYAPSEADDPYVKEAEVAAIDALYKAHPTRMLADVISREIQVVAGLNHRFRVGMGGGNGDFRKVYEIVVYQKLDGSLEVTDISDITPPG